MQTEPALHDEGDRHVDAVEIPVAQTGRVAWGSSRPSSEPGRTACRSRRRVASRLSTGAWSPAGSGHQITHRRFSRHHGPGAPTSLGTPLPVRTVRLRRSVQRARKDARSAPVVGLVERVTVVRLVFRVDVRPADSVAPTRQQSLLRRLSDCRQVAASSDQFVCGFGGAAAEAAGGGYVDLGAAGLLDRG